MLKEMAIELEPMLHEEQLEAEVPPSEPEPAGDVTYYRGVPVQRGKAGHSAEESSTGVATRIYRGQKVG